MRDVWTWACRACVKGLKHLNLVCLTWSSSSSPWEMIVGEDLYGWDFIVQQENTHATAGWIPFPFILFYFILLMDPNGKANTAATIIIDTIQRQGRGRETAPVVWFGVNLLLILWMMGAKNRPWREIDYFFLSLVLCFSFVVFMFEIGIDYGLQSRLEFNFI